MVQSAESQIQKLLLEHNDPLKVADLLLKNWAVGGYSWAEQETIGHFLINCGYYRAFFDQVMNLLRNNQKIPWSALAEALARNKVALTKEDIDHILVGASEENSLNDLLRCVGLDHLDKRFGKIRQEHRPAEEASISQEVINRLPMNDHNTAVSPDWFSKFEGRRANEQQRELKQKMLEEFQRAAQKPNQKIEAAIALGMTEAWEEALQILNDVEPSKERTYLQIEFSLQAKKALDALKFCKDLLDTDLNSKQRNSVLFYKAQALIQMNHSRAAIGILSNIIANDPNHFKARALLNSLNEEVR